jgi:hypothetical protein
MSNDLQDFEQFMKRREETSQSYVQGDAEPLSHIVARVSPATFFPPTGGFSQERKRWLRDTKVAPRYLSRAAVFASRYCKWQPATALLIG